MLAYSACSSTIIFLFFDVGKYDEIIEIGIYNKYTRYLIEKKMYISTIRYYLGVFGWLGMVIITNFKFAHSA